MVRAVMDGAQQIAAPAFVSSLAICIVFVPVVLLTGAARYLFTPLAYAVAFAMMASYLLSRTLIPTMVRYLLKQEIQLYQGGRHESGHGPIWFVHHRFNARFERLRGSYTGMLDWVLDHRIPVLAAFLVFVVGSFALLPLVGQDFFPTVDSGQIRLHARGPSGTRIEQTEVLFAAIDQEIRNVIPPGEIDGILDNIGLPPGGVNLAMGDSATIGPGDGDILISLTHDRKGTVEEYTDMLRKRLNSRFPNVVFFFEAANITNQILNFGLPAPIDVQVIGRNTAANYPLATRIAERMARIPGAADVHIHQVVDYPELRVAVDRVKAGQLGLTQRDVASSMLISLSSSGQVAPAQWLNWANGVNYNVAVQTPQYRINSLDSLLRTPVSQATNQVNSTTAGSMAGVAASGASSVSGAPSQASAAYGNPGTLPMTTQMLSNLATVERGTTVQVVNHYNVQPVFDIYANVDRRDLGSVGTAVQRILREFEPKLPKGTSLDIRGQFKTMQTSFTRLGLGMVLAVILVYLLMVVNFQSWLDPFIILMALPGALAGAVWTLFITQTSLSVPSLMGVIMSIGVATANSILLVVFANDQRAEGLGARAAALEAGHTRIRPVLMTAAAMIMGMLPMALGFGEGGEQNAPLGRVVIGGLLVATLTTLFIVPVVYSMLRKKPPVDHEKQIAEEEAGSPGFEAAR
jgi:multidrug efflux pump subunit AcrB